MPDRQFASETNRAPDPVRRGLLLGGGVAAGVALAGAASAQTETDRAAREMNGQPVPEPPPEKSAGPVRPGRVRC